MKLMKGEALGASCEEGYMPNGIRRNFFEKERGSKRAVDMLLSKLAEKPFTTEYPMIGGFAVVITQNDGVNPEINLELLGRHTVGTGSAPQAVISSLVTDPLDRAGLKITDIDKYSPEMQNPDITKPAGAGDVPLANYKMIAALAVKRGEIEKADLMQKKELLDQQISVQEKEISNVESQISTYAQLITQTQAELADAQEREAAQYELFCRRVRAMVDDREREIEAFQPEEYWTLDAVLRSDDAKKTEFSAHYHGKDGKKAELKSAEEVEAVVEGTRNHGGRI